MDLSFLSNELQEFLDVYCFRGNCTCAIVFAFCRTCGDGALCTCIRCDEHSTPPNHTALVLFLVLWHLAQSESACALITPLSVLSDMCTNTVSVLPRKYLIKCFINCQ
eukprot:1920868-Amphidinium_carterae.1